MEFDEDNIQGMFVTIVENLYNDYTSEQLIKCSDKTKNHVLGAFDTNVEGKLSKEGEAKMIEQYSRFLYANLVEKSQTSEESKPPRMSY